MGAFRSSRKYYQFYKYGFGFIAFVLTLVLVLSILTESTISVNGEDVIATWSNAGLFLLLALILLIVQAYIYRKVAYVEIFSNTISIESADGINEYGLEQVDSIEQLEFMKPPLYRVNLKALNKSYLFVIHEFYVEFGGFVKDLSEGGQQLEKIKKNLPNTSHKK